MERTIWPDWTPSQVGCLVNQLDELSVDFMMSQNQTIIYSHWLLWYVKNATMLKTGKVTSHFPLSVFRSSVSLGARSFLELQVSLSINSLLCCSLLKSRRWQSPYPLYHLSPQPSSISTQWSVVTLSLLLSSFVHSCSMPHNASHLGFGLPSVLQHYQGAPCC